MVEQDQEMLTVEETARLLKVHPETVLRALRAGKLRGGKIGVQWRIARIDLNEYLRTNGRSSTAQG